MSARVTLTTVMTTQLVPTTLAVSRVYVMQDIPVMEKFVPVNILRNK
jgi:hypothetical protein